MPETAQTLDRGIRILTLAGASPHGLTVAELAAELAVGRAVVYRLVATLERNSLVRRGADGRIRLWLGLLELAHDVQPHLRDIALPRLRSLAEAVGATAHLTIADGGEALALAVAEPSWTGLHVAYRVGSRHPLGQGAAGRAILLGRDPDSTQPYAVTVGELQDGAYGVAAPIRGVPGLQASVGVVAMRELQGDDVGPRVAAAARQIATALT
ncbi:MAG TPA: helix-turn-helix domain-containing protein [Mycobacteriales bacterium]|jgi:DNA-binding IclR family transcriptional regulator